MNVSLPREALSALAGGHQRSDGNKGLPSPGWRPIPARRVLSEIRVRLQFPADHPGAGHVRNDLTDESVKFWPIYAYLIVYDPASHPIGVARILHAHRDLQALFVDRPPKP